MVPGAPHGRDPAQTRGAPGQVCDGHAGEAEAGVRGSPPGAQGDHHQGSPPSGGAGGPHLQGAAEKIGHRLS